MFNLINSMVLLFLIISSFISSKSFRILSLSCFIDENCAITTKRIPTIIAEQIADAAEKRNKLFCFSSEMFI